MVYSCKDNSNPYQQYNYEWYFGGDTSNYMLRHYKDNTRKIYINTDDDFDRQVETISDTLPPSSRVGFHFLYEYIEKMDSTTNFYHIDNPHIGHKSVITYDSLILNYEIANVTIDSCFVYSARSDGNAIYSDLTMYIDFDREIIVRAVFIKNNEVLFQLIEEE
ncbi:hypothetical protein [Sediminitomix flava]|uniref:Uncharacterized protein n=1 Tax=Sediminitomix flava TaxID=379075 RepID=A0A315ZGG3_SEDFL|nr:hypothetical protein [Sediminitomix flava]PWJ44243.1 hypothetical protein BC781_101593 [Sediminitomix flava]